MPEGEVNYEVRKPWNRLEVKYAEGQDEKGGDQRWNQSGKISSFKQFSNGLQQQGGGHLTQDVSSSAFKKPSTVHLEKEQSRKLFKMEEFQGLTLSNSNS